MVSHVGQHSSLCPSPSWSPEALTASSPVIWPTLGKGAFPTTESPNFTLAALRQVEGTLTPGAEPGAGVGGQGGWGEGQLHTTAQAVQGTTEGLFPQTETQPLLQTMRRGPQSPTRSLHHLCRGLEDPGFRGWGPAAQGQGGQSGW